MKILINTSILRNGGVQVALSFIVELLLLENNNEYVIVCSTAVKKQIDVERYNKNYKFYTVEQSPAKLMSRKRIVKKLDWIEKKEKPDVIFTVFGPAYWKSKAPHICGFALPWIINPENPIIYKLSNIEKFKNWLIKKYKWYHFYKEADYLWCETEDVKNRINYFFGFPKDKIAVVGNTFGAHFKDFLALNNIDKERSKYFKMVTISAYYPHKNLEIIKEVIPLLKNKINFQFILTLPETVFLKLFSENDREYIKNIGPIPAKKCPEIYAEADAMFLPTMLECFSANYPEAMIMEKPILTSNYSFAKDICQDAAEFFNPLDPNDVSQKIIRIASDKDRYMELIKRGKKE